MSEETVPVVWRGSTVGHIANLNIDMFDWYGQWIPANNLEAHQFLERLRAGEELQVKVGDAETEDVWTIDYEPDQEITLKFRSHS